jgi:hypothetical protein
MDGWEWVDLFSGSGRVGLDLIENWVGWVGIGFSFFLGVSGLSPWVDVELLIYHSIHIY